MRSFLAQLIDNMQRWIGLLVIGLADPSLHSHSNHISPLNLSHMIQTLTPVFIQMNLLESHGCSAPSKSKCEAAKRVRVALHNLIIKIGLFQHNRL